MKREWLKEPTKLTKEVKARWFDPYPDRDFICNICGENLVLDKLFGSMMTNFGNHHGGNPFVGECCMGLDFKTRLAIWDEHKHMNIYAMAKQIVLARIGDSV